MSRYTFKLATEEWEFNEIHKLNYETFVKEIPQHTENDREQLVDAFYKENTYMIALCGNELAGMMAVRGSRPFSLDRKLEALDTYLPRGYHMCEIRLLSVRRKYRNGRVFAGLVQRLLAYCTEAGYELALISGTVRQQKLYRHLGFVPFGSLVGTKRAQYQPMYATREMLMKNIAILNKEASDSAMPPISFLPGPVQVAERVRLAFEQSAISHRSEQFVHDVQQIKRSLCQLTNARHVEIMLGSGTLANDVVAGQLSRLGKRGLILCNGEFGARLIKHAEGLRLSFQTWHIPWGEAFVAEEIEELLLRDTSIDWIWAVHCETSTGMMNDITMLKRLCAAYGIRLCLDCISSLGVVPVDLRGVYAASSVSGKGLGGYPGLCMVFYHHDVHPAPDMLPRYMDLGVYAAHHGIPFTQSSNLMYALKEALVRYRTEEPFVRIAQFAAWFHSHLRAYGIRSLCADEQNSLAVFTIELPPTVCSRTLGEQLEEEGYIVSYRSAYLLERNWMQFSFMGECDKGRAFALLNCFLEKLSSPLNELIKKDVR